MVVATVATVTSSIPPQFKRRRDTAVVVVGLTRRTCRLPRRVNIQEASRRTSLRGRMCRMGRTLMAVTRLTRRRLMIGCLNGCCLVVESFLMGYLCKLDHASGLLWVRPGRRVMWGYASGLKGCGGGVTRGSWCIMMGCQRDSCGLVVC